jgi:hypothetical protein
MKLQSPQRSASRFRWPLLLASVAFCFFSLIAAGQEQRWPAARANDWYAHQPWLVGSNFAPSNAINQLEMWQADTFDPKEIDRELGWGESLGMNTMRVFLHDLPWKQDPEGFTHRISIFLEIANRHHIRPIFVLFDSCWDPSPKLGPQHPPIPGVHNSGWVQSPGSKALEDPAEYKRLQNYVQGLMRAFGKDERVLAWDLWNEPDNTNGSSWSKLEPANKVDLVAALLPKVFAWARELHPMQPLTSGVWQGDWSSSTTWSRVSRIQLEESDIISFHNYGWPEDFEQHVRWLERLNRPILCTEYMARPMGSTFDAIMPIARTHHVALINWGFVAGKTQTYLPWDSWQKPYVLSEPPVWFHDIFHPDGTPYRPRELEIIKEQIAQSKAK